MEHDDEGISLPPKLQKPRQLPSDLPTSLDDRRAPVSGLGEETEYYDAWAGRFSVYQADTGFLLTDLH